MRRSLVELLSMSFDASFTVLNFFSAMKLREINANNTKGTSSVVVRYTRVTHYANKFQMSSRMFSDNLFENLCACAIGSLVTTLFHYYRHMRQQQREIEELRDERELEAFLVDWRRRQEEEQQAPSSDEDNVAGPDPDAVRSQALTRQVIRGRARGYNGRRNCDGE